MNRNKLYFIPLFLAMLVQACTPEIEVPKPSAGNLDLSKYVALGDSYAAGYADGALYLDAQKNSYPALIAQQLATAGAGDFKQPLVPAGNGVGSNPSYGKAVLSYSESSGLLPSFTEGDLNVFNSVAAEGPFQNLGVPGARSFHLLAPEFGAANGGNPFYTRFCSNPGNVSIINEATAQAPTFFSLWIGGNDVLGYALDGGADTPGNAITPSEIFDASIDGIIANMQAANPTVSGVIGNIPDITQIPYFTTVPWNAAELTAEQAQLANDTYKANIEPSVHMAVEAGVRETVEAGVYDNVYQLMVAQFVGFGYSDSIAMALADATIMQPLWTDSLAYLSDSVYADVSTQMAIDSVFLYNINALKAAGIYPQFHEGTNALVIEVPVSASNPLGIRHIKEGELILLSALGDGLLTPETALLPKPDAYVLDADEVANIRNAISQYNAKLAQAANLNNFAFVDLDAFFKSVIEGILVDNVRYDARFVQGNTFSLDGIHLTQRGSAFFANEYIKAINAHYNAGIPLLNVTDYPMVYFPE
ncbi:MAG: hypothetical protein R2798_14855 [Chitinophagales bacterium]